MNLIKSAVSLSTGVLRSSLHAPHGIVYRPPAVNGSRTETQQYSSSSRSLTAHLWWGGRVVCGPAMHHKQGAHNQGLLVRLTVIVNTGAGRRRCITG